MQIKLSQLILFTAALFPVFCAWSVDYSFGGHTTGGANPDYDFGLLLPGTNQVTVTDNFYSDGLVNNTMADVFTFVLDQDAKWTIHLSPVQHLADLGGQLSQAGNSAAGTYQFGAFVGEPLSFSKALTAGSWRLQVSGALPPAANPFSTETYLGAVTVTPIQGSPPLLSGSAIRDGQFSFTVKASVGSTNIVEGAGALCGAPWVSLATNIVAAGGSFQFATTNLSSIHFFRVRQP
ncbi:MAG TPA: hypothetical protein VF607_16385 [Verrucomicrobiae bacterium]